MAATTPITQGRSSITPYPIINWKQALKSSALLSNRSAICGVVNITVIGTGKRKAERMTSKINFFRFNLENSHATSLSNPLTPCHPLEVLLKTLFADMSLRYLHAIFHKSGHDFSYRQIRIIHLHPVIVLYGKLIFMKKIL